MFGSDGVGGETRTDRMYVRREAHCLLTDILLLCLGPQLYQILYHQSLMLTYPTKHQTHICH